MGMQLGIIFTNYQTKEQAFKKLALWYNEVESSQIEAFRTVCRSVQAPYLTILNYLITAAPMPRQNLLILKSKPSGLRPEA
jgi:hypothetical protein